MEFKGTKGNWSVDKSGYRTTKGGLCVMNDNQCIAVIGDGNPHHPIEANALLISKAPEMLDFINRISGEMLRNDFVLEEKWYEQAQKLIKEATTFEV